MARCNAAGIALIKLKEGLRLVSYNDPLKPGVWTMGYGETNGIHPGMTCTPDQADQMLEHRIDDVEAQLNKVVTAKLNDNQWSALVVFAYNLGVADIAKSPMMKLLNAGKFKESQQHWILFDKSNGVEVPGLKTRRQNEIDLFNS